MSHDYDVWITYRVRISDVADAEDAERFALDEVHSPLSPDDVEVEEVNKP